uniref:Uncharacterized protein n=1 Tax=Arion vulgaris TaxID=1028688 RepID=A0A0B7AKR8_9EUPU
MKSESADSQRDQIHSQSQLESPDSVRETTFTIRDHIDSQRVKIFTARETPPFHSQKLTGSQPETPDSVRKFTITKRASTFTVSPDSQSRAHIYSLSPDSDTQYSHSPIFTFRDPHIHSQRPHSHRPPYSQSKILDEQSGSKY